MTATLERKSGSVVPPTKAEDYLVAHGLGGQIPVPVHKLAKKIGFNVWVFEPSSELKNISGAVDYDKKEIYLSGEDGTLRQRFTLAHEIGHIFHEHGKGGYMVDLRENLGKTADPIEAEANKFAADLLMPPMPFIKEWINLMDVDAIAERFQVSRSAAKIRLKKLGLI